MTSGETYTLSRAACMDEMIFAFNQIRFRSGQPGLTPGEYADDATMDATVKHERLIEMFCEGRRFYDIRRWGIYEEEENKPIMGMNINANSNAAYYERTIVNHADARNRVVDKKMVFLPLERNEVRKSRILDQNPGW